MDQALAKRLAPLARTSTLRLTHYGRRSGKPFEVTIWFLVDGDLIYLLTANMQRQWTRNVRVNPKVSLRIAKETFAGNVSVVSERDVAEHVMQLLMRKYWYVRPLLWLSAWLGRSSQNGGTFKVRVDAQP